MSRFEEIRTLLETDLEQIAQATDDPERFRREVENLQRYWQSGDDEEALLQETLDVLRSYPAAWDALERAGLVAPAQTPAPAETAKPAPLGFQAEKVEEGMQSRQPGPETGMANAAEPPVSEQLALWEMVISTIKELFAGLLGVLIVGATLGVAIYAMWRVSDAEASARIKDILLLLNGLAGVVLGYYFGRIPGEARADKAEGEAKAVRSDLDRTMAEMGAILEETSPALERGMPSEGTGLTAAQAARLRDIVRRQSPPAGWRR